MAGAVAVYGVFYPCLLIVASKGIEGLAPASQVGLGQSPHRFLDFQLIFGQNLIPNSLHLNTMRFSQLLPSFRLVMAARQKPRWA